MLRSGGIESNNSYTDIILLTGRTYTTAQTLPIYLNDLNHS